MKQVPLSLKITLIVISVVIIIVISVVIGIVYGTNTINCSVVSDSVSIIAIFKNESHILKEWIEHYISEGISKFHLINNGSTDDFETILKPFIKKKIVSLYNREKPYAQTEHYNDILNANKWSGWIAVLDLDEFLYSPEETIKKYLKKVPSNIGQISVPWLMFGSSGHVKQPKSVIDSFTWRSKNPHILVKSIVRASAIDRFIIHQHIIKNGYLTKNESINLKLNHYPIQSLEWFKKVKCTRGDVGSEEDNNKRNMQYFIDYDFKDQEDLTLKNKKM